MNTIFIAIIIIFCSVIHGITFPIISYSEDSGTILGLFSIKEYDNKQTRQLFFMTQKKGQTGLMRFKNIPVKNDRLNIMVSGSNQGQTFYGLNNTNTNANDNTLYSDQFKTQITYQKRTSFKWDLIIGIDYVYYNENDKENNQTSFKSLNDFGLIIGTKIDKRNKQINPTRGYYNQISTHFLPKTTIVSNEVRYFYPFSNTSILATRAYGIYTITDDPHIMYLKSAGNYTYLRGYKTNIFMHKFLSFGQLEWRQKLTQWMILSPFVEIGTIGSSPITQSAFLFSYGIGTHIPFKDVNIRLEIAVAELNRNFYFGFNHTF